MPKTLARLPARFARALWWLAGILVVVAVLGFLVAPPLVRSKGAEVLAAALDRPVSIERVAINPFAPSVTVRGFVVKERDGSATAMAFDELYARLSLGSLFRFAPVVDRLALEKPYLRLVRNADGTYNFQDLIETAIASLRSDDPTPRFALYNVRVAGGRIEFDDRAADERHEISDLRAGLPFISSLPAHVAIDVQPELAGKIDGAPFAVKGEAKPFHDTHETTLHLDLDGLDIPKYLDYSPVPLGFRMPSGVLDTRLRLTLATRGERLERLVLTGTAALSRLELQDRGGAPLASAARLAVDLDAIDLVDRKAAVRSVAIDAPAANLVRRKDGTVNLLAVLPGAPPGAKAAPPFTFRVGEVRLKDGRVAIADEVPARSYRVVLQNIGVAVDALSNAPDAAATVKAGFDTDERGRLDYAGTVRLAPALAVDGKVEVSGVRLGSLYPYYEDAVNLDIQDGTLAAVTTFDVALRDGVFDAHASGLDAKVERLRVHFPGEKEPLARIASIEVKDGAVDLGKQSVVLGSAAVREAVLNVVRDADGNLLVERLFKHTEAAQRSRPAAEGPAWRIEARLAQLEKAVVNFEDRSTPQPARIQIGPVQAKVENLSTAKGAKQTLALDARIGPSGRLALAGPVVAAPLEATLRVDARGIPLPPIQPYLEDRVAVTVAGGTASAKGTLRLAMPEGGALRAAYRGDAGVSDFASADKPTGADLLKWKTLFVGGIEFDLDPLKVSVADVALSDFYSRLIVNADGTLNLQNLVRRPGGPAAPAVPAAAPAAAASPLDAVGADAPAAREPAAKSDRAQEAPAAPRGPPPAVRVGRITLAGGNVNFSDYFVKPNYSANLTGVGGTVTEMTADKAGELELRARVDNLAPVEIAGRVNPLAQDLFLDIRASAKDIELPPLTPYSVKYAGYGIEKGKLSVNVKYLVENRKLSAENSIYLDQLTFGERVESPTATKLPVLLAVSLLKDRNGVIDVNLPISGSLDDPQFSLGGIIVRVIVNLITKAVTAPFSLLAAAFGGGEELAWVEFPPGTATLSPEAKKRLDALAKALNDRPGLKMDIAGRIDPTTDRDGLKKAYVDEKVRAQKAKQLAAKGTPPGGDVAVDSAEYPALLKLAYGEERFPKPRNVLFLPKDLPAPEMEALMLANAPASDEALRELANRRAQAAKDYLVAVGKVPAERVFIVAPVLGGEPPKDKGGPNRADFALR
ncbi:MAG: DUF748 domain-containing protein [Burkholderiales bacterium]|nr:DUF748 domain-containing protein [Burkholderiales bacterium]